jgi:hypothetical protein
MITYVKLPDVMNNLDWLKEYFHLTDEDLVVTESKCGLCKEYHKKMFFYRKYASIVNNLLPEAYKRFCKDFQCHLNVGDKENIFDFVFLNI